MAVEGNPFAVLSLIVAPAVLTNASSVLVMSTSNRLGRVVDRARTLSKQLEGSASRQTPVSLRRASELRAAERRSLMLLVALRSFYVALGSFATAALLSLIGATLFALTPRLAIASSVLEVLGVVAGLVAVGSLVHGSIVLVRETRIAVRVLQERAAAILGPDPELDDPPA